MVRTGRPLVQLVQVKCEGCGGEMEKYPSDVARNTTGRFFCSLSCRNKVGSRPRKGAERVCAGAGCGKNFYTRPGSTQTFCSSGCRDTANRVARQTYGCEQCGIEFHVVPGLAKYNSNLYCSRACYGVARKTPVGTRKTTSDGYITVYQPTSPSVQATGWISMHRFVMEEHLGRTLLPGENVHHKNGARDDNRVKNLELWVTSQPSGQRVKDVVAHATAMLQRYAPERLA